MNIDEPILDELLFNGVETVEMPGPAHLPRYTRMALRHAGVIYFAVRPFFEAWLHAGYANPFEGAELTEAIPQLRRYGEVFVPAWWLQTTFAARAETINRWRELAYRLFEDQRGARHV